MAENNRAKWNESLKSEQIRDAKGNLMGYKTTKPNILGYTQVWDNKGQSLGFSKDAASGGLPFTIKFGQGKGDTKRISHGNNPDLLFGK